MPLERLPGWVIDNETSVREEVAPYIDMTMAERWEATQRCCEAAAAMLRFHREPEEVLSHRDPVPHSTLRALARLQHGSGE
jgi:hypothetical protein